MSVKEEMNGNAALVPSNVSRKTVADGAWLQKYTFGRLSARDDFLADCMDETISGYSELVDRIDNVSGEVDNINEKIETMSPLTYKGTTDVAGAMAMTATVRNGSVYSMSAAGTFYPDDTYKKFKVKKGDDVAWASADNRWFPVGQDFHVEIEGSEFINVSTIEDVNTISLDENRLSKLEVQAPLTSNYENNILSIGFSPIDFTANKIVAEENNNDNGNRPITWYNTNNTAIYYNTEVFIKNNGISSYGISSTSSFVSNISSTNLTALTAQGNSAKFTNISSNKLTAISSTINYPYFDLTQNNTNKDIVLYFGTAVNQDSTFSSTNVPKIKWTGKNNTTDCNAAITFTYFDIPGRFGTSISTANVYTQNVDNPGGWFNFTLRDGTNDRAGILTDSLSSTTLRTLSASGASAKFTNISGNATITNTLRITGSSDVSTASTANTIPFSIGPLNGEHMEFDGNEILAKSGSNVKGTLYLNSEGDGSARAGYFYCSTATGASAKFTNISATNLNGRAVSQNVWSTNTSITSIITANSVGNAANTLYLV